MQDSNTNIVQCSSSYQLSHLISKLAKNLKFIPAFAVIVESIVELHWM